MRPAKAAARKKKVGNPQHELRPENQYDVKLSPLKRNSERD